MNNERKPRGYWTEETIKKELDEMVKEGKSLEVKDMKKHNSGLYQKALKSFNNWKEVLDYYGYEYKNYGNIYRRSYETKEDVQKRLEEIKETGVENLRYAKIKKIDAMLYTRSAEYFGTYEKALKSIGVNTRKMKQRNDKGYWDKERVLEELEKREDDGKDMKATSVHSTDISLYRNMHKYFGGYQKALKGLTEYKNRFQ